MKAILLQLLVGLMILATLICAKKGWIDLTPDQVTYLGVALISAIGALQTAIVLAAGRVLHGVETSNTGTPTALTTEQFNNVVKRSQGN